MNIGAEVNREEIGAVIATLVTLLTVACDARPRPGAMEERGGCPFNYAPVCGGDGETHANACIARSNNTVVAYAGVCRPGVAITCRRGAAPACGTDNRAYLTRCVALTAGGDILHNGACNRIDLQNQTFRCGGLNGARCATGGTAI